MSRNHRNLLNEGNLLMKAHRKHTRAPPCLPKFGSFTVELGPNNVVRLKANWATPSMEVFWNSPKIRQAIIRPATSLLVFEIEKNGESGEAG
jgi:hypothetical protein